MYFRFTIAIAILSIALKIFAKLIDVKWYLIVLM